MSEEVITPETAETSDTDMAAAMVEQMEEPAVEQAALSDFNDESIGDGEQDNLDAILDIPIALSVEIGQTKISIRNLLQLNQGSVVELDRLAGEPLDVMVNNTLVAHGEIVVVNEKYGIRLTDVISALERVKNLQ